MTAANDAFLVRITGRVQGVSYRVWTRNEARALGLTGWVRNEADGSVLALIAGPSSATAAMLDRFWTGPAGASVTNVDPQPTSGDAIPDDFRISA
jgi:acylphosphatase